MSGRPRIIVDPETYVELDVPEFTTAEAALAKERDRRQGRIRQILLGPDEGYLFPLSIPAEGPVADPGALGVDEATVGRLRAWQAAWETHFHYESGWRSPSVQLAWVTEGESLYAELHRMLWERFDLIPGFRRLG